MGDGSVLYMGDTSLHGAAAYLAGLMTHWGWSFDYLPSNQPLDPGMANTPRKLFVLSDYPSGLIDTATQQQVVQQVAAGAGLLMIGGWESFHGHGGNWAHTPIADALPVEIATTDDRINCDQPTLAIQQQDHPITANLPWRHRPPTIGGFNQFKPKPNTHTLLEAHRFQATDDGQTVSFKRTARHPLLVVGEHSSGRTAALATDVAPHWVGGLVDWGEDRVTAQAQGAYDIEVGNLYAAFLRQLLGWTGRVGEGA